MKAYIRVLEAIQQGPIDAQSLAEQLNRPVRSISCELSRLSKMGLIARLGEVVPGRRLVFWRALP